MTIALELLDHFAEIGASVRPQGNDLIVRAGPKSVPAALVQRLREAKAEVLAALAATPKAVDVGDGGLEPAWWRRQFTVRSIHWELGGYRSRDEAEVLAWAEMQCRWYKLYGERVSQDLCAGCRRPIGTTEALDLRDGNRVHDCAEGGCLIRHGERWRAAATRALIAMGLVPRAIDFGPQGPLLQNRRRMSATLSQILVASRLGARRANGKPDGAP